MADVNPLRIPAHLPYLLDLVHRRMQQDLGEHLDASAFPQLRGSHFRILSMIPPEGARPSVLAATANMTRPALGELVRHLQDHGYVRARADASDGRAVIVHLTSRGKRAAAAAAAAIDRLHRHWAEELGADRLDALVDALTALSLEGQTARLDPTSRIGR